MKKPLIFTIGLVFMMVTFSNAKIIAKSHIEKVSQHERVVTFQWKVNIHSDKNWQACDVMVSFRDEKGNEILNIKETVELGTGDNAISGYEICSSEIWDGIQELMTTVDCIF